MSPAEFHAEAERRQADAAKDKARLDHLEKMGQGKRWIARPSATGRGYRLHNCDEGDFSQDFATAREAIDDAMEREVA